MNTNLVEEKQSIKTSWKVDPAHSELFFKIQYLMISTVTGFVTSFDLEVHTSGQDFGEVTHLHLTADMKSLSTNHGPRDEHLKSPDFFDVENHPHLKFQATSFEKQGLNQPSSKIKSTSKFVFVSKKCQNFYTINRGAKLAHLNVVFLIE